jgi:hypothetical protein
MCVSLLIDDEPGLGPPADDDGVAGRRNEPAGLAVLMEDGDVSHRGRHDDLRRDTDVRTLPHLPLQDVRAPSPSRIFSGLTPTETLPLRPAVSTVTTLPSWSRTLSVPSTAPPSRFEVPRKFATNAVRRPLVEIGWRAELLDLAEVHDGDRVGHRHRFF